MNVVGWFFKDLSQKMNMFRKKLIGNFRWQYLPPVMVYFAYGASTVTSIAATFWVKEKLGLSPAELAVIGFWVGFPWTIKMVFGQVVDSFKIFGSNRWPYIILGGGLVMLGYGTMVGLAAEWSWLGVLGAKKGLYLLSQVAIATGFMFQDVVADAMTVGVVDTHNKDGTPRALEEINADKNYVQWLGRLFLMTAMVFVSGLLSGWLAKNFSYSVNFTLAMVALPVISLSGLFFMRRRILIEPSPVNWSILGGGIIFGALVIFTAFLEIPFGEEAVFAVSLAVLSFLLYRAGITKAIVYAAIVIFIYRATPGAGDGIGWWYIDALGFDKQFLGLLSQIGAIMAVIGMLVFRKYIIEKPIGFTLAWLTIVGAILVLPNIGLFYGIHEKLGISARTVAFVDQTISAPFGQLSMVPLLALIARTTPLGREATWFALMASMMNLALSASSLGTKYLNVIYPVSQAEIDRTTGAVLAAASYGNVGMLMIVSTLIGLVLPLLAIFLFLRDFNISKKDTEVGKKSLD